MKMTSLILVFLAFGFSNAFSQINFEDLYTYGYQIKKTRYIKTSDGTTNLISTKTYKFGMTKRSYVKLRKKNIEKKACDNTTTYPNPFTDKICYFEDKLNKKLHDLKIVDNEGIKQVIKWRFTDNDKIEINASDLKSGTYSLLITYNDGTKGSINLFKNQ